MRYFENLHPICIFIYFMAVIGMTLACFHPIMLLLSLTGAFFFLMRIKGGKGANQWITLEAIAYGLTAGMSLAALILWFGCYSEVMTSEKFLYLFGKIAPASALLISMALQLVPKLNRQLGEIRESQEMLRPAKKNFGIHPHWLDGAWRERWNRPIP